MIKEYITEGRIVPMEVTIKLLENAMKEAVGEGKGKRFLVDGFPRQMDQAVKFDESVRLSLSPSLLPCPHADKRSEYQKTKRRFVLPLWFYS